jgi:hypothetical protein
MLGWAYARSIRCELGVLGKGGGSVAAEQVDAGLVFAFAPLVSASLATYRQA